MPKILTIEEVLLAHDNYIVTLNMQHLYESELNPDFHQTIFKSQYAAFIVDGRGAKSVLSKHLRRDIQLFTGVQLARLWMDHLKLRSKSFVMIIGSKKTAVELLQNQNKNIDFIHFNEKYDVYSSASAELIANKIQSQMSRVTNKRIDLVIIALGVPKQELLAASLKPKLLDTPIICIGGALEILTCVAPQAPRILKRLWLEPFWRLAIDPSLERLIRLVKSYYKFYVFRFLRTRISTLLHGVELT